MIYWMNKYDILNTEGNKYDTLNMICWIVLFIKRGAYKLKTSDNVYYGSFLF
jgi:hypothetical protein